MAQAKATATITIKSAALPYTHKAYRPYTTALGQLALAWNGLHEILELLFCHVMGGGFSDQYMAIWTALKADRVQRDILVAAAPWRAAVGTKATDERFAADILWICEEANKIEETRNNAIHSPLAAWRGENTILPATTLGHRRAQKLSAKGDPLKEFRWCRDTASVLTDFAFAIMLAYAGSGGPWPHRPRLPNRGQKKSRESSPQSRSGLPAPPIPPSRALPRHGRQK